MSTEPNARQGHVQGMAEKRLKDLNTVGDLVQEVAHFTTEEFAAARPKIEGKLAHARSVIDGAHRAVTEKAAGAADATHVYVRENLWTVLGLAAVTGLIIGFLLSRR